MLKQKLQKEQGAVGKLLKSVPISANQVTLLSLVFAFIAAYFIIQQNLLAGGILFLISGALDAIDGAIARAKNQVTKFGGFFDGAIDRIVESIFLISLMFYPFPAVFGISHTIWLSVLIVFGTFMPSFVRAYADHKQVINHEKAIEMGGIFERTERIIAIFVGVGLAHFVVPEWLTYITIAAIILSIVTVIQRLIYIHKQG
ncbi:CDP-alcohol phosphatidyltransferase family protein [Candidatus Micrarchaeota archaeon]|nr:CDP-alcohol phosphatidyltransferase family protein [Candidatus Micrarchaeota archaeon]